MNNVIFLMAFGLLLPSCNYSNQSDILNFRTQFESDGTDDQILEAHPGAGRTPKQGFFMTSAGIQRLNYNEIRGDYVYQGDIILDKSTKVDPISTNGLGLLGVGIKSQTQLWTDGIVYYDLSQLQNQRDIQDVRSAMSIWEEKTGFVKFIESKDQGGYLSFVNANGCWSYMGKTRIRGQKIAVGPCGLYGALHEIGHALGLAHEQSRLDRDDHVTILFENIREGMAHNFDKANSMIFDDYFEYNFNSIMQYHPYSFSKNGKPTIVRKDGGTIPLRINNLSQIDVDTIKKMYGKFDSQKPKPIAQNDTYVAKLNSPLTKVAPGVLDNDLQAQGMVAEIVSLPSNGSLGTLRVGNTFNGSFTYTPENGFVGKDTFTYRILDDNVASNIATVSIDVVNLKPSAMIAGPNKGEIGKPLALDGGSSADPDAGPLPLSFQWEKLEGPGNVTFSSPTSSLTNATFSLDGTYKIQLATSDGEAQASSTIVVNIENPMEETSEENETSEEEMEPVTDRVTEAKTEEKEDEDNNDQLGEIRPESNLSPIAIAGPERFVYVGERVKFNASKSHDPDGEIRSYRWVFGEDITNSKIKKPSVYFNKAGTYKIQLFVTDDQGATGYATTKVTVLDGIKVSELDVSYKPRKKGSCYIHVKAKASDSQDKITKAQFTLRIDGENAGKLTSKSAKPNGILSFRTSLKCQKGESITVEVLNLRHRYLTYTPDNNAVSKAEVIID